MLRAYYGDQNFENYLVQVKEAISRQAMQTGIDPATNKPLSGQEKVDITLMERPMARLRRSSFVQMMNGAVHFISKPRTEQAKDIFELGKSPEFEQATAELMPKVQDPFKAAEEARQRGPKIKGTVELGVSEFFMPPKQ